MSNQVEHLAKKHAKRVLERLEAIYAKYGESLPVAVRKAVLDAINEFARDIVNGGPAG
jgi:predicted Ser/Thr protein kinase